MDEVENLRVCITNHTQENHSQKIEKGQGSITTQQGNALALPRLSRHEQDCCAENQMIMNWDAIRQKSHLKTCDFIIMIYGIVGSRQTQKVCKINNQNTCAILQDMHNRIRNLWNEPENDVIKAGQAAKE